MSGRDALATKLLFGRSRVDDFEEFKEYIFKEKNDKKMLKSHSRGHRVRRIVHLASVP